jgi:secreted trypsin-like serine protease
MVFDCLRYEEVMKQTAAVFGMVCLSIFSLHCATEEAEPEDADLVGGVQLKEARWDAIGSIGDEKGSFCTATLISPRLVVSARHCIHGPSIWRGQIFFSIGFDSTKATRKVLVEAAAHTGLNDGGWTSLGSDVAVFRLAQPIRDIAPVKVGAAALTERNEGTAYTMVGYGRENQDKLAEPGVYGIRKGGDLTLRATRKGVSKAFPSFTDFVRRLEEVEAKRLDAHDRESAQKAWDYALKDDYEVFLGLGKRDVQNCHGDSGGPLLAPAVGTAPREVVGVLSGGVILGTRHCRGAFFAIFGPEARKLLQNASSCDTSETGAACTTVTWHAKVAPGVRDRILNTPVRP